MPNTDSEPRDGTGLAGRAIPITLDGEHGDIEAFSVLDDLASESRLAFIGEMDHFVAEKRDARLMVCRYLASRGWRLFGEEWPDDEHQLPFERGILANDRQPISALEADQCRFREALARAAPESQWFSFDADSRDLEYVAMAEAATTYEQLRPAMALRERIMQRKVTSVLERYPSEKVALLAAAQHLLKDDSTVVQAGGGAGPGGGLESSLGHHAVHRLSPGRPVLSFWIVHGMGMTANPWLPPPGRLEPAPGSLDAELMATVGVPCLVPVGSDNESRLVTAMHNQPMQCRLAQQVDAIIFIPHVSPLEGKRPD